MSIRMLIADDHEVLRRGLASLVEGTDIEIVAEATTGDEAVRLATEVQPDIVLLDIRMENCDGLTALQQIKQRVPHLPVLMLSTFDNPTYVGQAMTLGASGYLLKGVPNEEILAKIRQVATGENVWTADELRRFGGRTAPATPDANLEVTLTPRELDVLKQVARGATNKEIGKSLFISAETVKEHIQNILRKIGVSDRTQAAIWAVRNGIV